MNSHTNNWCISLGLLDLVMCLVQKVWVQVNDRFTSLIFFDFSHVMFEEFSKEVK